MAEKIGVIEQNGEVREIEVDSPEFYSLMADVAYSARQGINLLFALLPFNRWRRDALEKALSVLSEIEKECAKLEE